MFGVWVKIWKFAGILFYLFIYLKVTSKKNVPEVSIIHFYFIGQPGYVMFSTIWYHLYNLKNMKNTNGGVLLLAKLQAKPANLVKMRFLHGCFSRFLNCTNETKSCNASCILKIKSEVGFIPSWCCIVFSL